jgi:hypothetical protein
MVWRHCQLYYERIQYHPRPSKLVRERPASFVPRILVVCSDLSPPMGHKEHCVLFLLTVCHSGLKLLAGGLRVPHSRSPLMDTSVWNTAGSYALLLVAQLVVGVVAPCFQVVGPRYAELWFDLNGRATTTMIIAICTYPFAASLSVSPAHLVLQLTHSERPSAKSYHHSYQTSVSAFLFWPSSRLRRYPSLSPSYRNPRLRQVRAQFCK